MKPIRVTVPLTTDWSYGMEHAVLDLFDLLRPEVYPHFVLNEASRRHEGSPVPELLKLHISHSFIADRAVWPRIARPASVGHLIGMFRAAILLTFHMLRFLPRTDVLYLPGLGYARLYFVIIILFRMCGKRVVYHFHELTASPSKELKLLNLWVDSYIHNGSRSLDTVRRFNPFILRRANYVAPCRVRVRQEGRAAAAFYSEFGGHRNILFMGQVSEHKGIDLLITSFCLLSEKYPDLRLDIVGRCTEAFQAKFEQLLQGAPGNARIRYWGYRTDARTFLGQAYLHIQPTPPSRCAESFGRSTVEAMAVGVPTICFRSGQLQDIVIHNETGLICEEEEPLSLARCMSALLDAPHLRAQYSSNCRKLYSEMYSDTVVRTALLPVFLRKTKR